MIGTPQDNVTALRAAVQGYVMEHGVSPDFVIMSHDVASAVFNEIMANPAYKDFINTHPNGPMMMMDTIEMAQAQGTNRVELASNLGTVKVRKALGAIK